MLNPVGATLQSITHFAGDEGHLGPARRLQKGAVHDAPDLDGVGRHGHDVGKDAHHVVWHSVPLH